MYGNWPKRTISNTKPTDGVDSLETHNPLSRSTSQVHPVAPDDLRPGTWEISVHRRTLGESLNSVHNSNH